MGAPASCCACGRSALEVPVPEMQANARLLSILVGSGGLAARRPQRAAWICYLCARAAVAAFAKAWGKRAGAIRDSAELAAELQKGESPEKEN